MLLQMPVYFFTFGMGQTYEGYCQPIIAENEEDARVKMVELYGRKWAFQYTESEYLRNRADGFSNETLLEHVVAIK